MYLVDTVVLSELRKQKRNAGLTSWVERQRTADLFLSVITIGEIERGIARQRAADRISPRRSRIGSTVCWHSTANGYCRLICRQPDVGAS